jgi:serpin B
MRKSRPVAVACGVLLVATGCQSEADGPDAAVAAHLEASSVSMAPVAARLSYRDLAVGQLELGSELAESLSSDHGNLVYSPASLAIAFAMLREGASGRTAREIDSALHLPADRQAAYNGLLHQLAEAQHGDVLEVGDGLFLDPSLTVEQSYLRAIKQVYGAGVEQTDFPGEAVDVINGWVDRGTHGRIPRLVDQLDPDSVFALVNTIYLDAKWRYPFLAPETFHAPFTTATGSRLSVQTMHQTAELDYAEGSGWQAVRLPYRGGSMSMWVLLPAAGGDPKDLLKQTVLSGLRAEVSPTLVDLSLPRWDTETTANLTDVLEELGMTHTFYGSGDFSAVTADPAFAVTQVLQQANITVAEKGTKASAATAIIGEAGAAAPLPDPVRFTADHPFAFVVLHDATGVPLFEGTVGDPS